MKDEKNRLSVPEPSHVSRPEPDVLVKRPDATALREPFPAYLGPQTWHGIPRKYAEQVFILRGRGQTHACLVSSFHQFCLGDGLVLKVLGDQSSFPPIFSLRWIRFDPNLPESQKMGQGLAGGLVLGGFKTSQLRFSATSC
eukprot:1159545-Pelagomonas_calceolata.AAC.5